MTSFTVMDLRQLNALVGVADHGSFSAAAEALDTVQSNISAHVARLERELGAVLVDRSGGRLTDEGQLVVARARRVAEELDSLVAEVAGLRCTVAGTVRVGMIGTTARWLVPRLLETASARHPDLHLVVVEGTTTWLEPQIASGRLDMAVLSLPVVGVDVVTTPLFDEDLVLVVPAGSAMAERESLQLAELADLELLLPLPGTAFREELDAALRPERISLKPRAELDGVRLIASLTFEGFGPAILPATAVPRFLRSSWAMLNITGLPRRRVGVAQRRRSLPSSATRALLAMLEELAGSPDTVPEGLHPPTQVPR